jgi:hypothetical protein
MAWISRDHSLRDSGTPEAMSFNKIHHMHIFCVLALGNWELLQIKIFCLLRFRTLHYTNSIAMHSC